MNKIFRVIWNHATQSWVAVSELQPAKGKTKSVSAAVAAAVVVAGAALVSDGVYAAYAMDVRDPVVAGMDYSAAKTSDGTSVNTDSRNTILIGKDARSSHDGFVSVPWTRNIGYDNLVVGKEAFAASNGSVVIGNKAIAGAERQEYGRSPVTSINYPDITSRDNVVAGYNAYAGGGQSVVLGANAKAESVLNGNNAIMNGAVAVGAGSVTAAPNTAHADRKNPYNGMVGYKHPIYGTIGQIDVGGNKVYDLDNNGQFNAYHDATRGATFGYKSYSGIGGLAVGTYAVGDKSSVAVGGLSVANGTSSVALGIDTYTEGNSGIAVGRDTAAIQDFAVAMGSAAAADGRGAIAVGHSAKAAEYRSVAIGSSDLLGANVTYGTETIDGENILIPQLGSEYNQASQTLAAKRDATALGSSAQATGLSSTAIGAVAEAKSDYTSAIGYDSTAEGKYAVAVGAGSYSLGESAASVGDNARAFSKRAVAIGVNTKGVSNDTVAIGPNAIAGAGEVSDALKQEIKDAEKALADARTALAAQEVDLREKGEALENTKPLTKAVVEAFNTSRAEYLKKIQAVKDAKANLITVNNKLLPGKFNNSVAIGKDTISANTSAVTVGVESHVEALNASAFGYKNKIEGAATDSVAFGAENKIETKDVMAAGARNTVQAEGAYVIGSGNIAPAAASNTFILGKGVTSAFSDGVILGANSADAAKTSETKAVVNGVEYGTFAGSSPVGVVSVGKAGDERQIKNVAAGRISATSTDAINGSQLYFAMDKLVPAPKNTVNASGALDPVENEDENGPRYVNSTTVRELINDSYWNIKIAEDGGKATGATLEPVKAGDTVKFIAGKDIVLTQNGKNITIDANVTAAAAPSFFVKALDGDELTDDNSGEITPDATATQFMGFRGAGYASTSMTGKGTGSPTLNLNIDDGPDTVVDGAVLNNGRLDNTATPNTLVNGKHMADALNKAGWGLKVGENGGTVTAGKNTVERFNPADTIQFEAGKNVKLTQTATATGQKITIDVNLDPIETTTLTVTGGKVADVAEADKDKAVTAETLKEALNSVERKVALEDNDTGFTATNNDGVLVVPGDTVKFTAGKNLKGGLKADETNPDKRLLTLSLSDNLNLNKVTSNTSKLGPVVIDDKGINAGGKNISNVPAGKGDSDLVNRDMLNAHKWFINSDKTSGAVEGNAKTEVSPSENDKKTVTLKAGEGIEVTQEGTNITFAAAKAKDVVTNTTTGKVEVPEAEKDKFIDATTVSTIINDSFWKVGKNNGETNNVKRSNEVRFVNGTATTAVVTNTSTERTDIKYDVKTDGSSIIVNGSNQITAQTHPVEVDPNTGKVKDPEANGSKLVNVGDLTKAINDAAFKVATDNNDTQVVAGHNEAGEAVKAGDKVQFVAGKNLAVKQDDKKITFALEKDITVGNVKADKVDVKGVVIDNKGINAGGKQISNVTAGVKPTDAVNLDQLNSTVAQQIWKLNSDKTGTGEVEGNVSTKVEPMVEANKTVTLKAGEGIEVTQEGTNITFAAAKAKDVVTNTTTGKVEVPEAEKDKFIDATTVSTIINDSFWKVGKNNGETNNVKRSNEVRFVDSDTMTATVTNTTAERTDIKYDIKFTQNVTADDKGVVSTTDKTKLAVDTKTAVKAINESGWIVTSAVDETDGGDREGEAETKELVNPGTLVTFKSGKNIKLKQKDRDFTYSTQDDVNFNSMKVENGQNNVNFTTPADGTLKLTGTGDGTKSVTVTNVDKGAKTFKEDPNYTVTDNVSAAKADLIDFNNSPETNAMTVADAENLAWIVSTVGGTDGNNKGNGFAAAVPNAQQVDFAGRGVAKVNGEYVPYDPEKPEEGGVHVISVDVNAQELTNSAEFPVVYTTKDGKRVYKQPDGSFSETLDGTGKKHPAKDIVASMNDPDSSTTNPMTLTNVKSNLPETYNDNEHKPAGEKVTKNKQLDPTIKDKLNNVATVGDVLNAGWNLTENGTEETNFRDFVKPYDTVNFVNGTNTIVNIESDGTTSKVKVEVNTTKVLEDIRGDLSEDEGTGKAKVTGDPTKLATTSDVRDAVNNSGWKIALTDDNGKPTGDAPVVKKGDTVTFNKDTPNTEVITELKDGAPVVTFNVKKEDIIGPKRGDVTVNDDGTTSVTDENKGKLATVSTVRDAINNSGWKATIGKNKESFADQEGKPANPPVVNAGSTVTFLSGTNLKVKQEVSEKGTNITYALENEIEVNSVQAGDGKDGPDGVNGKIGVNGADGSAVILNGEDGSIGLRGPKGADGKNALAADLTVKEGEKGLNGNDLNGGENKTRIVYTKPKGGDPETVATLNDGLKFKGNKGEEVKKLLNETLNVEGKLANDAEASAKNVRVDSEGGKLIVKLAETPEFKDVTLTEGNNTVKLQPTDSGLKVGDKNGNPAKITNVKEADITPDSTDLVNGSQLYQVKEAAEAGWNLSVNKGQKSAPVKPRADVDLRNTDGNIKITKNGNNVNYALSKDIKLGDDGSIKVGGVTVNNKGVNLGNKHIVNVAPGRENNDAANVDQLKGAMNKLNNKIAKGNKELYAGVAGANAAAGLPQVYIPGKSMIAGAAGTYSNQAGIAVGYSRASDNGKIIVKAQGNTNTRGDIGGSVGLGYQW